MNLFPLDLNKEILLNEIITSIKNRINQLDGLERITAEVSKKDTKEIDNAIERWKTYCDVIRTVAYHEDEFNRDTLMYEQRGWNNEWDVPIHLFNESVEAAIERTQEIYNFQLPQYKDSYKKQLNLLQEIKDFRNK